MGFLGMTEQRLVICISDVLVEVILSSNESPSQRMGHLLSAV